MKYWIFPVVKNGYSNIAGSVYTAINMPLIIISIITSYLIKCDTTIIYIIQDVMALEAACIGLVAEDIVLARNLEGKRKQHIFGAIFFGFAGLYLLFYIYWKVNGVF